MNKLMEIVVYILAAIGLACVVKHIHISNCREGCCLCNSFKSKVDESKTRAEGIRIKLDKIKTKVRGFKTKEEERKTGSRYGSNPVKY